MISATFVRYLLKAAIRDRLLISFSAALVVAASLALFLGSSSVIESGQFALVYMSSSLRIMCVVALSLAIAFMIRRGFDMHEVEFILARPISRLTYVLSHAVAFLIIALVMGGTIVLLLSLQGMSFSSEGYIHWAVGFLLELAVVAMATMFFSFVLSSAVASVMAVFGYYMLARLNGELLGIVDSGMVDGLLWLPSKIIQLALVIAPRFDLYGQSEWLIYGFQESYTLAFLVANALLFMVLLVLGTMIDFVRREF